jgi:hypothetical protein
MFEVASFRRVMLEKDCVVAYRGGKINAKDRLLSALRVLELGISDIDLAFLIPFVRTVKDPKLDLTHMQPSTFALASAAKLVHLTLLENDLSTMGKSNVDGDYLLILGRNFRSLQASF